MSNTIQLKRRTTGAATPPSALSAGEPAYNEINNVLYIGRSDGSVVTVGGQGAFLELNTDTTAAANYTFSGTVDFTGTIELAGTEITATAAELNLLDGAQVGTINSSKAVVYSADGAIVAHRFLTGGGTSAAPFIDVTPDYFAVTNGSNTVFAVDTAAGTVQCGVDLSVYDATFTVENGSIVVQSGDINVNGVGNKIYVNAQEVATKDYVDSTKQGLDVKDSVRVATTANITLSGLQTIDGVTLSSGNRVLVKNQTTASQNGIYVAAAGTWSRATDADASSDVTAGMYAFVSEGTTQADSGWVLITNDTIILGVTALTFTQFSGAGQITAGAGLTKNGNTLNLETASTNRIVVNADNIDLAVTGVSAGVYGGITVDEYGRITTATNNVFGNGAVGYVVRVGNNGQLAATSTISDTNLPTSGVTAGTYSSVTVDSYGRVTAGDTLTLADYDITATAAELNLLDGANGNSVSAGKVVVYNGNGGILSNALSIGGGLLGYVYISDDNITTIPANGQQPSFSVNVGSGAVWIGGSLTLGGTQITATATELNTLDGITADVNELNTLDGITASTAELNILDGVTADFAELNLLDGAAGASVVNDKAVIYSSFGQIFANGFFTPGDRFAVNSDSDLTIRDASNNAVFSVDSDTGTLVASGSATVSGLVVSDAATLNVASISAGTGAASFAQGALTIAADGELNIANGSFIASSTGQVDFAGGLAIGGGTVTASTNGELYTLTNLSVGNLIWLDATGTYAINVNNGAFYVGSSGDIYGADLAVVGNLSAGNGNFYYNSEANSLGIGALVVSGTISAAMDAFTVSSSGSVNIGSGNITANAELGDIAASGIIQAGSHLIAGSDISAANGNFFYDGAANSFSVSGTFSVASGVFSVDNGGSLNIGSGNIIADAPSGDLSCSGYFSTAGSAGIDGDLTVGGDINVINTGKKIYIQSKEVATKEYVDATKQGLDVKDSVRVATTANITLSGLQTIDGVLVASGDRVLVKNQTTASQNGIYVAASGSWARAADADASSEVTAGMYAFVSEGTTQADSGWVLTTNDTITLGTTALNFTQFSGAGQITAGDGLTKSGNTLNVVGTTGRIVANADSIDLATTGVSAGSYSNVTVDTYGRVTAGDNILDGGSY